MVNGFTKKTTCFCWWINIFAWATAEEELIKATKNDCIWPSCFIIHWQDFTFPLFGKSPSITKPALGNLKPTTLCDDFESSESSFFSKIQQLENLNSAQNEEICELRRLLQEEKSKNNILKQQIQEMTDFLEDHGMHCVGGPRPQLTEYLMIIIYF